MPKVELEIECPRCNHLHYGTTYLQLQCFVRGEAELHYQCSHGHVLIVNIVAQGAIYTSSGRLDIEACAIDDDEDNFDEEDDDDD